MPRIKVLHIIKSLGRGGAEMLLPETLKLHDKTRFEFYYIYFLPWKNQMVKAIEEGGGRVENFPARNNLRLLLHYKKVLQYCKTNEIDLIHCHLPWSGFVGRIVHQKTKIPVVYTEHNIQEHYHNATKKLNKLSFNWQSLALGVSEDVTNSIKKNIDPEIPVQTLLNGVNTTHFQRDIKKGKKVREKHGIPPDAMVIGNIAVFREQKNIPDWLRAFKEITHQCSNVYGLVVGAGVKEEEIRNLVEELDLSSKVILPGLQTDTVSYFSAMDIFMMSSSFEGLPIALLEAMSMECAVVSTEAGGVVEAVRDGEDGLLCRVGDWKALANNTVKLVKDNQKLNELQAAARNRVKEFFSLQLMVEELEKIYSNIER